MKKGFAIAAAAALVIALALVIPPLLGGDHDLPPLPRLVYASGPGSQPVPDGLLTGADLTLAADLPDAPAEAPVYRVTTAPLPATPEEALAWARDFGLPNPQVYRDPREPEALFVLVGDDGQQLTFRQFGPMGSIDYGNDAAAAAVEGTPLSFDRAVEVAVSFLRQHDLLPNPIRFVHVVRELDGHPLVSYRSGAQVAVNPAGQVTYASFNPLTFERDGNYPIKPAQEAYDELTGGQVAGSPFRLGGTQYDLTGPRLAELATVRFEDVQIRGTIVAQMGEHHWQVEVTDWETVPPRKVQCLVGAFTPEGDDTWLVTDDGKRYRLPNPPTELDGGQRIEACADELPAAGGDLAWWSITAPPASESAVAVESVSVSSVSVVVEAEEIPPGTSVGVESPVGIPTPEAPFEIGQSVEVTGVVHATIFVGGESRRVEAWLDMDEPGEDQPPYLLSGSSDILEAIAQLDRLHVRVRGQVVISGQEWTPGGLGIEIEDFQKVWPDEQVRAFLGHIDLEMLEGREVAVFTERETGQRYVLGPDVDVWAMDYARPGAPPPGEQTWVAGVIHPTQTFAGLPVLAPREMRSGSDVEAATGAGEIPLDIPQVRARSSWTASNWPTTTSRRWATWPAQRTGRRRLNNHR